MTATITILYNITGTSCFNPDIRIDRRKQITELMRLLQITNKPDQLQTVAIP